MKSDKDFAAKFESNPKKAAESEINNRRKRYEKTSARLAARAAERTSKQDRDCELRFLIEAIKQQPFVREVWDEGLWVGLLKKATVFHDGRRLFQFKNGTEIEVGI